MRRAAPLVISFFMIVLGAAIILQAFDYHALFRNVRVPGWAFGLVGLAFFSGGLWFLASVLGLANEAGPMLGGLVGLSVLGVAHYLADGFGIGGWIVMGIIDFIAAATIVHAVKRRHQKEKA